MDQILYVSIHAETVTHLHINCDHNNYITCMGMSGLPDI